MTDNKPPFSLARYASFYKGNAVADNVAGSGWFVGQFVPDAAGMRHQLDVELKWGIHRRGDRRVAPAAANRFATTISILVRGALEVHVTSADAQASLVLCDEGDYLMFGPDVGHSWEALEDAVVLSIRYPSIDARYHGTAGPVG